MPLSEPTLVDRLPQPYAAIPLTVPQDQIAQQAPPLVDVILGWVAAHARQAGPMFFNYVGMGPGRPMDMEVGAPIETAVAPDGKVVVGTLPGGRYATVTWTGPYDQLREAHEQLHQWLARQGFVADVPDGRMTLLEIYHTDPAEEPDPQKWVTEIAFKLGD